KLCLAALAMRMRLADSARPRIQKESAIVSLTIVVASGAKSERRPENQDGGRERPPTRLDQRRVKRRKVWAEFIVSVFEGPPGCVNTEAAEYQDNWNKLKPPRVAATGSTKPDCRSRLGHEVISDRSATQL